MGSRSPVGSCSPRPYPGGWPSATRLPGAGTARCWCSGTSRAAAPRRGCQASSALVDRTLFFYDHEGDQLGTFVHPRPQSASENCTWHHYDVVPTDTGRILVSGNCQSGLSVLDFTDPANVREIAFADPAPLVNPDNPNAIEGGGDRSTYWYNGRIYESDMTRGLTIWNLSDRAVAGARSSAT